MSYNLRIRLEHHDFLGKLSQIDILERDYAGNADVRTLEGNEPMVVNYGDKSGNELPTVYGSEAIMNFFAEYDFEFLSLYTSDSKKYRVDHKYDGTLVWSGFISPENWSEPLTATTYQVSATATDGLGALKNSIFPEYAEGTKLTLLQIIAVVLENTGLQININTAVDFTEVGQTAGTDILSQTYKQTESLAKMNCYDLLEEILLNCRIFQRLGQWWVVSYSALRSDTIAYKKYTYAGAYVSAGTIGVKLDSGDYWIENEPQLDMLPALKQQIFIQDYGYNKSLITNGSFAKFNEELAKFDTWTNLWATPEQLALDTDGNKFVFIPGKQYPDTFAHEGYGLITNGITKSLPVQETTSKLNFAMKYALMGSANPDTILGIKLWYSCLMFINIRVTGATNSYYLRRERYSDTRELKWEWINYNDKPSQGDDHICMKSAKSWIKSGPNRGKYANTFEDVTAYPPDQIIDHFEEFRATAEGIPGDGVLELYLYVPYTNRQQHTGSCYTGVTLELVDETDNQYPEQKSFKVINNVNNNYKPDDRTLVIGDLPQLANANIIYSHGLFRANGTSYTSGWSIPGSASYTFVEFACRLAAAEQANPRQVYSIRMQGITPTLAMVIDDITTTGRRLLENGISYDNRMGAIEGNYTEIPTLDIDALTVEVATEFDEEGLSIQEIPATPKNIEERVTLIDENGVKVSSPGYLYDKDFELKKFGDDPILDDMDGLPRFQIKKAAVAPYNLNQAAGQLQFSLTSVAEVNFGGNANQVKFSAGQLLIHNYNALDKDNRLKAME